MGARTPRYLGLALGSLAMIACGVLIDRFAFPAAASPQGPFQPDAEARIANVRFLNPGTQQELEFSFDAVKPMRVRGTIHDERIQKVLTYALLNEQNPGVRLRAISTMAGPSSRPPDREMKAALIIALRSDENAGVRKEALTALRKLPFDIEIRDALLHALMHDKNPGIRIAAINGLDSAGTLGADPAVLEALKQKVNSDDNNYIRLRAKTVLQEVREQ
jgi:HEAT repeat protein